MDASAGAVVTNAPPKPPTSVLQVENLLKELKVGEVYDDKIFAAANHTTVNVGDMASIRALEKFLGDKMKDSMDMYFLCVKKKNEYRASIPRPTPQEVVDHLFPGHFRLSSKPVTEYDKEDTEVMTCLYRPTNVKKASVVIKIMSIAVETRKHAISHAQREVHMLKCFRARKQTQHICKLLDHAEKSFKRDIRSWQQFGIVMEAMELGTLKTVAKTDNPDFTHREGVPKDGQSRFKISALLTAAQDVLSGVQVLQKNGICHRDVKPGNVGVVFIPELGRVGCKLLDFGIAVSMQSVERYGEHWEPPPPEETISGAFASPTDFATDGIGLRGRGYGTLAFMAPEQSSSGLGRIGTYTDVFGVGATLYWCLTGSMLLGGDMEDYSRRLCDVKVEAAPALVTESSVSTEAKTLVVELLSRATRKRPKERFQTAEEMRVAVLAAARANQTSTSHKADEPTATAASAAAASSDNGDI